MYSFDISTTAAPWVLFAPAGSEEIRRQLDALEAKSGRIHHFDAENLGTEGELFHRLAEELVFPGYFGHNWDAVVDCLDDLCAAVTGGVGMAGLIHGADRLVDAGFLRILVSVLCQGAARANSDVDLDGDPLDRPATVQHFVFLLDELKAADFVPGIEHPDLIVAEEGEFLTVTLNPDEWYS